MRFCFTRKDFVEREVGANKLAVVGDDMTLTWAEFSNKVDKLCDSFSKQGLAGIKHPVAIYGHKSANMIVAIYAMMKL